MKLEEFSCLITYLPKSGLVVQGKCVTSKIVVGIYQQAPDLHEVIKTA